MAESKPITSRPYVQGEKFDTKKWRFRPGVNGGELISQPEMKERYDKGQAEKAKKPLTVLDKFDDAVSGGRKRSAERPFSDTGYYQKYPRSNPTPSTPKGPGPKKGPRKPPVVATQKTSVVAKPQRSATISNVNVGDRGGYTTSRPSTGWGAGNKSPYAKEGSSRLASKSNKAVKGRSAGATGLKWFNGKD